MKYAVDLRNVLMFHVVSPVILIVVAFLYFTIPRHDVMLFILIAFLIGVNVSLNLIAILTTYNSIEIGKKEVVLTKGFLSPKIKRLRYEEIRGFWKTGFPLPGLKAYDAIIPLKGLTYDAKRDTLVIHHSFMKDSDFENLKAELDKKTLIRIDDQK